MDRCYFSGQGGTRPARSEGREQRTHRTQPLPEPLDLRGQVVTAEAMPAQVGLARHLVEEKGADDVCTVQGNHAAVLEDLKTPAADAVSSLPTGSGTADPVRWSCTPSGRDLLCTGTSPSRRRYRASASTGRPLTSWGGNRLRHRRRLAPAGGSERLLQPARVRRKSENRLHWVRDVTGNVGRCQVWTGTGPHSLATWRNRAMRRLLLGGFNSMASALRSCAWDYSRALELVGLYQ